MRYTKLGFGDATPGYSEDTRTQCDHCNNHHDDSHSRYCSHRCWYLSHIGIYKRQINVWIKSGDDAEKIIMLMCGYGWFESITDSSWRRWKRAIHALFEVKLAKAA